MSRQMPERWKCADGRVLLIREMSDDHIKACLKMMRERGYISQRDWRESKPEFPCGFNGEYAEMLAEQGFNQEWADWCNAKTHVAIDAFHLELAYRRRHGVKILDAKPAMGQLLDPVAPPPYDSPEGSAFVASANVLPELAGPSGETVAAHRGPSEAWDPTPYREPRVGDEVSTDRDAFWDDLLVVTEVYPEHGSLLLCAKRQGKETPVPMQVDLAEFKQDFHLIASLA